VKVAIVSGGTSGIGRGAVDVLLNEGFAVVTFSRDTDKCAILEKELEGKNVLVLSGDVADETFVKSLVEKTMEKYNQVDVLVNNAGWGFWTSAEDGDISTFRDMLDTNVVGVATLTKHVIPHMKDQKSGVIVNISSKAGKNGYVHGSFYCATKFAVMGYSESIRLELRPHGIRVCTICPGMVDTNLFPPGILENRKALRGELSMMEVSDTSAVLKMIVTQSETSNIEDVTIGAERSTPTPDNCLRILSSGLKRPSSSNIVVNGKHKLGSPMLKRGRSFPSVKITNINK